MEIFIGLMTGTSLDGLDLAAVSFQSDGPQPKIQLHAATTIDLPAHLIQQLRQLCHQSDISIHMLGQCHSWLGDFYAESINSFIEQFQLDRQQIKAIGSHGQTIRHCPPTTDNAHPFTLQIGDPARIAIKTGFTTVADFRSNDLAAGGQAAPLAPAFHQWLFHSPAQNRAVVNIGGISNLTLLAADPHQPVIGFDCGPGNLLMDHWCMQHLQQPYDKDGQWAASGDFNPQLLEQLLSEPYLQLPIPKSTGRELFNPQWLNQQLSQFYQLIENNSIAENDVQATLLEFTAISIAQSLKQHSSKTEQLFICGGGAYNSQLKKRLQHHLKDISVATTEQIGLSPDLVEAVAFAWLAQQRLQQQPSGLPSVTGAKAATIQGAVWLP